jgi:hypothetical protein
MKERLRAIIAEESIRAMFLGLILLLFWAILVIQQAISPNGWSFLMVVVGPSLLVFGLIVGLRAQTGWRLFSPRPESIRRWEGNLTALLLWILISLLAIALIGDYPYLGLAIAIVGGITLGIISVRNFETGHTRLRPPETKTGD